mgnify:FL=1|tara:strand:- start:282 stop:599 length:318 start_codon:yes stop_codon:yes gene_type:complete
MKKIVIIIFVFSLIFFTAFIKNSSKKIEDEIFLVKESLRDLKKELSDTKLEFEYLSSTEKLLQYQSQFFEKDLFQKDINKIKRLTKKSNNILISNFNFFEINEKN